MVSSPPRPQGVRHFAHKGMDSGDEFFFHHFLCSSDDSSSDDEDLMVAALVVHDHIQRQLPRYRGSVPGRAPNLNRNRERGHALLYADTFPTNRSSSRINSVAVFEWRGMCSIVFEREWLLMTHSSSARRMPLASLGSPLTRNAPRPSTCLPMEFQAIWWMSTCV